MSQLKVQLEGHVNIIEVDDNDNVIARYKMDNNMVCVALKYVIEQGLKNFLQNEEEDKVKETK